MYPSYTQCWKAKVVPQFDALTKAGSSTIHHLSLLSGTQTSHFHRQWELQSDEARVLIKGIIFESWTPTNNLPTSILPET